MENLRTDKTIDEVLHEKEIQGTDETNAAAVMNAITNKQDIMADNEVDVNEELLDYEDELETRAVTTIDEGNEKGVVIRQDDIVEGNYVSIHSSGFCGFLVKPEAL